jgi:microcin C transport system ATP-binding protein
VRDLSIAFGQGANAGPWSIGSPSAQRRASALALVGESGSGKPSPPRRSCACCRSPRQLSCGEILFRGRDVLKMSDANCARCAAPPMTMVFQEPMTSLNPLHTIERQIGEIIELHERPRRAQRASA